MNGIERTRRCVHHYRSLGLCPLPSRMDVKGPMLPTYAEHYRGEPVPESVYRDWRTTNVQVVCGATSPTPTKVIVVDIDSDRAREAWWRICARHGYAPGETWVSRSGSGGWHFWFTLPRDVTECPSGMIYGAWDTWGDDGRGKWIKHLEIRILADHSLVIAPPSIHVETKRPYRFVGSKDPNHCRLPEVAPGWLLDMPRLCAPKCVREPLRPVHVPRPPRGTGRRYTREEVLDAVGDRKLEIAKSWGLVTVRDHPNASGWVPCFVPGREDPRSSRPSGSFNVNDGTMQDRKDLTTVSFFDLAVRLGRCRDWRDMRDELGDRFIGGQRHAS